MLLLLLQYFKMNINANNMNDRQGRPGDGESLQSEPVSEWWILQQRHRLGQGREVVQSRVQVQERFRRFALRDTCVYTATCTTDFQ